MFLQQMQEIQNRNGNHNGKGSGNSIGGTPMTNLNYQGLLEFRKATPPSFHMDYDPTLVER